MGNLLTISATDGDISQIFLEFGISEWVRLTMNPERRQQIGYFGLENFRSLQNPTMTASKFRLGDINQGNRFGLDRLGAFNGFSDDDFLRKVKLSNFIPEVRVWLMLGTQYWAYGLLPLYILSPDKLSCENS